MQKADVTIPKFNRLFSKPINNMKAYLRDEKVKLSKDNIPDLIKSLIKCGIDPDKELLNLMIGKITDCNTTEFINSLLQNTYHRENEKSTNKKIKFTKVMFDWILNDNYNSIDLSCYISMFNAIINSDSIYYSYNQFLKLFKLFVAKPYTIDKEDLPVLVNLFENIFSIKNIRYNSSTKIGLSSFKKMDSLSNNLGTFKTIYEKFYKN